MELPSPKITKIQERTFRAQKIKKHSEKISYIREMEHSSPELKQLLCFFKKKFLYFRRHLAKPEKQKFLVFLTVDEAVK